MGFLDLCKQYFGTQDFYEVLNVPKEASENEVRKAYYKLSLTCHPDRVEEEKKVEANERFKVLGKIHSILSDPEKRASYDDNGVWDEEDEDGFGSSPDDRDWEQYWRGMFKQVTVSDIDKYMAEYQGSDEERGDIKRAYVRSEGNLDMVYEFVPFSDFKDEERIRGIIQEMIDQKEVTAFDMFINEPQAKRDRRMRKAKREEVEAKKREAATKTLEDLKTAMLARRDQRSNFLDNLEQKYSTPKSDKKSRRGKK